LQSLNRLAADTFKQGDQIGRIFDHWVTHYYGHFWKIKDVVQIFGPLFTVHNVYALFFLKEGWATFWAIFS
jgi:hypothetical protein